MKRIPWIDFAKTLAIFLTVWLGTQCNEVVDKGIQSMLMPAFLLISGYLFTYRRNPAFQPFLVKRARQLVIPYYWMSVLTFVMWLLVLRHYMTGPAHHMPWQAMWRSMILCIPGELVCNVPLWCFFCFFVVEMVFWPLGRRINPIMLALIAWIGAVMLDKSDFDATTLPFALGPALCGLGFYAFGWGAREYIPKQYINMLVGWQGLLVSLPLLLMSATWNEGVDFYRCSYGVFPMFVLSSVTGAIVVMALGKLLSRFLADSRTVRMISTGTLLICGLHMLIFPMLKAVGFFCFGLDPEKMTQGVLPGLAFALCAFLLTLPIVYVVQRWLPGLTDKGIFKDKGHGRKADSGEAQSEPGAR